jgi:hypothetical protein
MSLDSPVTQTWISPRVAVRRLVEERLVRGLDDAVVDRLRDECWDGSEDQLEDAGLLALLTFFYETPDRGARDGFVWHAVEFWHDCDDLVGELALALGDEPPLFQQRAVEVHADEAQLRIERCDGQELSLAASSPRQVVQLFNAELHARGRPRRFVELETGGDWQMFVAIDLLVARRLVAEGVLPVASLEALSEAPAGGPEPR